MISGDFKNNHQWLQNNCKSRKARIHNEVDPAQPVQNLHNYILHRRVTKDSARTPIHIVYEYWQLPPIPWCIKPKYCLKSTPIELNDLTDILTKIPTQSICYFNGYWRFLQVQLDWKDRDELDPAHMPVCPFSNPKACDTRKNTLKAIYCSRPSTINQIQSRRYNVKQLW